MVYHNDIQRAAELRTRHRAYELTFLFFVVGVLEAWTRRLGDQTECVRGWIGRLGGRTRRFQPGRHLIHQRAQVSSLGERLLSRERKFPSGERRYSPRSANFKPGREIIHRGVQMSSRGERLFTGERKISIRGERLFTGERKFPGSRPLGLHFLGSRPLGLHFPRFSASGVAFSSF